YQDLFARQTTTQLDTLTLHAALPISFARSESHEDNKQRKRAKRGPVLKSGAQADAAIVQHSQQRNQAESDHEVRQVHRPAHDSIDRKSTRLNSSHGSISYAVFCLKQK